MTILHLLVLNVHKNFCFYIWNVCQIWITPPESLSSVWAGLEDLKTVSELPTKLIWLEKGTENRDRYKTVEILEDDSDDKKGREMRMLCRWYPVCLVLSGLDPNTEFAKIQTWSDGKLVAVDEFTTILDPEKDGQGILILAQEQDSPLERDHLLSSLPEVLMIVSSQLSLFLLPHVTILLCQ